jgi:hypothetical protein
LIIGKHFVSGPGYNPKYDWYDFNNVKLYIYIYTHHSYRQIQAIKPQHSNPKHNQLIWRKKHNDFKLT